MAALEANAVTDDVTQQKAVEVQKVEASEATLMEHDMSPWQALKLYPKAALWSMGMSFATVMDSECHRGLAHHCGFIAWLNRCTSLRRGLAQPLIRVPGVPAAVRHRVQG